MQSKPWERCYFTMFQSIDYKYLDNMERGNAALHCKLQDCEVEKFGDSFSTTFLSTIRSIQTVFHYIWVKEGTRQYGAEEEETATSPFQSRPTINLQTRAFQTPQQESGRQRSICRVFCRRERRQPSANVSDFIMQSVTVVRSCPDSLFWARAKARISIECGAG